MGEGLVRCPRCSSSKVEFIDEVNLGEGIKEYYGCLKCGHFFIK